ASHVYGHDDAQNTHANPPFGYGSSQVTIPSIIPGYDGEFPSILPDYDGQERGINGFGYRNTRMFSFFANGAYTYKKRYTLTGSYRTDASNMIVEDPKFRYSPFWSVGGSWNMKNEDFLKDSKLFDRLVLRGTHGVSGNTVTTASSVPIISVGATPGSRTGTYYAYIDDFGNPTLRWEKINQTNIAIDFSMFNRWLSGSLEVYNKHSEDLLANVSIAPTLGATSQMFNAAEVENKGFELNLNSNMQFFENQLKFNTGVILSHNTNEVTSLQVAHIYPRNIGSSRYVEGAAVAPVYSWVYGGMNKDNIPVIEGENGISYTMNENIGDGGETGQDVLRNMGTFIAPTSMGWNSTISFKGITLKANLLGKFGHKFRRSSFNYGTWTAKNYFHEDLDMIIAGRADEIGMPALPEEYEYYAYRWGWYTSQLHTLVEDASHIRLKELYLGFDLPQRFYNKTGIDKLRVYAHARNLGVIWAANDKGIDPEYIKGQSYKPGPTYTLGLNLEF
ncbi:MAG: TonB-dependent receptor, partial [Marinilabiliaceae bacterium]|nr:TonB-dependent receptor [Marinilabiliaceae bacterium]